MAEHAGHARREKIKAIEDGAAARVDKLDGQDTGKKHRGRKLSDSGAKAWMYHEVKEAHKYHERRETDRRLLDTRLTN